MNTRHATYRGCGATLGTRNLLDKERVGIGVGLLSWVGRRKKMNEVAAA